MFVVYYRFRKNYLEQVINYFHWTCRVGALRLMPSFAESIFFLNWAIQKSPSLGSSKAFFPASPVKLDVGLVSK